MVSTPHGPKVAVKGVTPLPRGASGAPCRLVLAKEDPSGTVLTGTSPRLVLGKAEIPTGRLVLAREAAAGLVLAAARTETARKRGRPRPSTDVAS